MKISLKPGREVDKVSPSSEYTVFAIYLRSPIMFMISVDGFPSAPFAVSADDVEIVDNRLSKYWVFGSSEKSDKAQIISFPEWAGDEFFYQNLVEGLSNSGEIWREYKGVMSLEFVDSSLTLTASRLGDGWLECAKCLNVWQQENTNEVVVCPSCNTKQNLDNIGHPH